MLLLFVRRGREGSLLFKEGRHWCSEGCILGCIRLIWIYGVQEFVLYVLGGMHVALSVCVWRMPVSQSG
jgi:hypothetical protein